MSEPTISCPSCGASYKRGSLAAGTRVKCRKCEAIIVVAEEPAAERAPARARQAGRGGAARGRGRGAARGRRGGRTSSPGGAEPAKKNLLPILIGAGVVIVAAVIFIATRGNGEPQKTEPVKKQAKAAPAPDDAGRPQEPVVEKPKPKSARQTFDEHVASANAATEPADRVKYLLEAAALLTENRWQDAVLTVDDLYQKVIEADPENLEAHAALGHRKYDGDHEKYKGQWLDKDAYAAVEKEWQTLLAKKEKEEAERREHERWTKDEFAKKCQSVRHWFEQDLRKVSGLKLKYFFDTPEIPKPYFLAIEDVPIPDPEQTAKSLGRQLAALRKTFQDAYAKGVIAAWDDETWAVPVLVFANEKSYENYRDNGHPFFPSTGNVAAFYLSYGAPIGLPFKGMLYIWQKGSEARYQHSVFHEAIHQIAHTACQQFHMARTPWIQEGLAEFIAAHTRDRSGRLVFGRFHESRWGAANDNAQAYYAWKSSGKGRERFMLPQDFLNVSRQEFDWARNALEEGSKATGAEKAKAARIQNSAYTHGWAFIFYSNYGERGKYREAWHKLLRDELRYEYAFDKLCDYYGLKSDEDWEKFNEQLFKFINRKCRQYDRDPDSVPPFPHP